MKQERSSYSDKFKQEVLSFWDSHKDRPGWNRSKVARHFKMNHNTARAWILEAEKNKPFGPGYKNPLRDLAIKEEEELMVENIHGRLFDTEPAKKRSWWPF